MPINNQAYQNITEAAFSVMSGKKPLDEQARLLTEGAFDGWLWDGVPFPETIGNPPSASFTFALNYMAIYVYLLSAYDSPYEAFENEPNFGGGGDGPNPSNPFDPDDPWTRFFTVDQIGIQNYDYNGDGIVGFEDWLIVFQMAFNPAVPYWVNNSFYRRMLEKGEISRMPQPKKFGLAPVNPLATRPGTRSPDGSNPQTGAVRGMREETMMGMGDKRDRKQQFDMIMKMGDMAASGKIPSGKGGMQQGSMSGQETMPPDSLSKFGKMGMGMKPQMGGMKPPMGGMPKMGGMKPPAGMPKMGGMKPPAGMPKMGGGMEQAMGMKPQMPGMGAMGGMQQPAPTPKMPSMSDQPQVKQKLQNLVPFDPNKKKKGMMGMGVEGEAMPKINNKKLKFGIPGMDDDRGDGNRYDKKGNLKALKRTGIEGEAMRAYQGARAGRQMFKTQARRGY